MSSSAPGAAPEDPLDPPLQRGQARVAVAEQAQQLEGLDIRRAFPDRHDLGVAQQPRRHMVVGVAIAADDLDGAAAGAVGLLGRLIFRQRRGQAQPEAVLIVFRGTRLVGGVEGAGRLHGECQPRLEPRQHLGELLLDHGIVEDRIAEGAAPRGIAVSLDEGAALQPGRPHGVVDAAEAERRHHQLEAFGRRRHLHGPAVEEIDLRRGNAEVPSLSFSLRKRSGFSVPSSRVSGTR